MFLSLLFYIYPDLYSYTYVNTLKLKFTRFVKVVDLIRALLNKFECSFQLFAQHIKKTLVKVVPFS